MEGGGNDETASRTPQSSKMVVETKTSTRSNGQVVVVTQTSFVEADPAPTSVDGTTQAAPGSLQNAAPRQGFVGSMLMVFIGVVAGTILL